MNYLKLKINIMNYYKESDNMNEINKSYEEVTFDKLYDTVYNKE